MQCKPRRVAQDRGRPPVRLRRHKCLPSEGWRRFPTGGALLFLLLLVRCNGTTEAGEEPGTRMEEEHLLASRLSRPTVSRHDEHARRHDAETPFVLQPGGESEPKTVKRTSPPTYGFIRTDDGPQDPGTESVPAIGNDPSRFTADQEDETASGTVHEPGTTSEMLEFLHADSGEAGDAASPQADREQEGIQVPSKPLLLPDAATTTTASMTDDPPVRSLALQLQQSMPQKRTPLSSKRKN